MRNPGGGSWFFVSCQVELGTQFSVVCLFARGTTGDGPDCEMQYTRMWQRPAFCFLLSKKKKRTERKDWKTKAMPGQDEQNPDPEERVDMQQ